MSKKENEPVGQLEHVRALSARKALDNSETATALSLIERATVCEPQNLITLLMAIGFQAREKGLLPKATALFQKQLDLCTNVMALIHAMVFATNHSRVRSMPQETLNAMKNRRRALEPTWNGRWENPNLGPQNRSLKIITLSPEQVTNPDDCLIAASQRMNWKPWMARYLALGGMPDNPKYLKVWASKAAAMNEKPSKHTVRILRQYTQCGEINAVRRFLRGIVPTCSHPEVRRNPNPYLARCGLLFYCECERLNHTVEDWVHISKSAVHLGVTIIERIVQRILAGLTSYPEAQKAFQMLESRRGVIHVTRNELEDTGLRGNPIWSSVHNLIPIDANARKILAAYSGFEISRLEI